MRADLGVYVDAVGTLDSDVRRTFGHATSRIERARLAYRAARQKLIQHVDSHGEANSPAVELKARLTAVR